MAAEWIDLHRNGQDLPVIRGWYEPTTFHDNDERVYLWSLLQTESKLRALIKANKPEALKEAA